MLRCWEATRNGTAFCASDKHNPTDSKIYQKEVVMCQWLTTRVCNVPGIRICQSCGIAQSCRSPSGPGSLWRLSIGADVGSPSCRTVLLNCDALHQEDYLCSISLSRLLIEAPTGFPPHHKTSESPHRMCVWALAVVDFQVLKCEISLHTFPTWSFKALQSNIPHTKQSQVP